MERGSADSGRFWNCASKDEQSDQPAQLQDKDRSRNLVQDFAAVWNRPTAGVRLKQRIVRILL